MKKLLWVVILFVVAVFCIFAVLVIVSELSLSKPKAALLKSSWYAENAEYVKEYNKEVTLFNNPMELSIGKINKYTESEYDILELELQKCLLSKHYSFLRRIIGEKHIDLIKEGRWKRFILLDHRFDKEFEVEVGDVVAVVVHPNFKGSYDIIRMAKIEPSGEVIPVPKLPRNRTIPEQSEKDED